MKMRYFLRKTVNLPPDFATNWKHIKEFTRVNSLPPKKMQEKDVIIYYYNLEKTETAFKGWFGFANIVTKF